MVTSVQFILTYSMFLSFFIFMLQNAAVGQYGILGPDASTALANMQAKTAPMIANGNTTIIANSTTNTTITGNAIADWLIGAVFTGYGVTNNWGWLVTVYNFFATIYNFFVFVYNGLVVLYVLFTFNSSVAWISLLIFTPMIVTLVYVIIKSLPFMGGGS